jgi:hypothetical protein
MHENWMTVSPLAGHPRDENASTPRRIAMHARLIRCALVGLVCAVTGGSSLAGCLERPAIPGEPTTKTNFTQQVQEQAVNKLDILFSIDNSASMGDKQAYLSAAIPDLIDRLLNPNCVDDNTLLPTGPSTPDGMGNATCPTGSQPEFPSVHDMHIGIVSSSLGPRLGDQEPPPVPPAVYGAGGACLPTATITLPSGATGTGPNVTLNNHNDDQAHLLTRSATQADPITEVDPLPDGLNASGFLAWFPPSQSNGGVDSGAGIPIETVSATLQQDFQDEIYGVHEYGCGIESQLESWYRFLIQPDPYASLAVTLDSKGNPHAQWVGVDTTIIKERHDFLRPDSLVAVIVLSDENDSEIDVRSIGGQGFLWMSTQFYPPFATSACAANAADPKCTSCELLSNPASDANCTTAGALNKYTSPTDWGYDLNLRHVHMQAKYGLDPQFPITRYSTGLTSPSVPDRVGEYPSGASNYVGVTCTASGCGTGACTNPLYAASLPDGSTLSSGVATSESTSDAATLCNLLPNGNPNVSAVRSSALVFFAMIGGVPWQLLHFDPNSVKNSNLVPADWVRILGQGSVTDTPENPYDYVGIDPHMIESYQPRIGTTVVPFQTATPLGPYPLPGLCSGGGATCGTSPAETAPQAPGSAQGADPYNGHEWITNQGGHVDLNVDREYACIFPLTTPHDCSKNGAGDYNVPANQDACDCSSTTLTADQLSPLCNPTTPTSQTSAKAYPTIRELDLAYKMGANGIVSSICPIDVNDNAAGNDPLYGYRPAVASIINRLKTALNVQCLPQTLNTEDGGEEPCLILVTLPNTINKSAPEEDCATYGTEYSVPNAQILAQFQATAHQTWENNNGGPGPDPNTLPTCQVAEIPGIAPGQSCKASPTKGWCYVTGAAAGTCAQAVVFSNGTLPTGAEVNLQCIESSSALAAGQQPDGG